MQISKYIYINRIMSFSYRKWGGYREQHYNPQEDEDLSS